jgi:hypothetical protein
MNAPIAKLSAEEEAFLNERCNVEIRAWDLYHVFCLLQFAIRSRAVLPKLAQGGRQFTEACLRDWPKSLQARVRAGFDPAAAQPEPPAEPSSPQPNQPMPDKIPGLAESADENKPNAPALPGSPEAGAPADHAPPPAGSEHPDPTPPTGGPPTGTDLPAWMKDPEEVKAMLARLEKMRQIAEQQAKAAQEFADALKGLGGGK